MNHKNILNIVILLIIIQKKIHSIRKNSHEPKLENICLSLTNYKNENREKMGEKSLQDYYKSGITKGKGAFGEVKKITFANKEVVSIKRIEIKKRDFKIGDQSYEELKNLQEFGNKEGFLNYIGCVYLSKNADTYSVLIITEYLEIDLDKGGKLFKISTPKKSERYNYYKKLFFYLKNLHSKNMVHLDIKPANIMSDKDLSSQNFNLKFIDFGLMRKIGITAKQGTLRYLIPSYFDGNYLSSFQRDIFALLITILFLEYGENQYITTSNGCYKILNYTSSCFLGLLDSIFLGYYKNEFGKINKNLTSFKRYFLIKNINKHCETFICLIFTNLKSKNNEFKTAEQIWKDFDKVIAKEVSLENQNEIILI